MATLSSADGAVLAGLAVSVVEARLAGRRPAAIALPRSLLSEGASFVTLERDGALRGCIGTIDANRPLFRDVARNAVRAMTDPRMPPVTVEDWPALDVKVSVLTRPEPTPAASREELLARLRPGVDGLIITDGTRRATFLPAVWDKLPDPERYLAALLAKGGWPAGSWPSGLVARTYSSMEFRDVGPRGALSS